MTLGMKKIMIEIPDHISKKTAQYEIDRAFSTDWISLHWHISDVQGCTKAHMSDDDARDILEELDGRHDASQGISWDTINYYVERWHEDQEEEEEAA